MDIPLLLLLLGPGVEAGGFIGAAAAVSSPVGGFMAISQSVRCGCVSVCEVPFGGCLWSFVLGSVSVPGRVRSPGPASYRRKKWWSPWRSPNWWQFAKTGILRPFFDESRWRLAWGFLGSIVPL